MSTGSPGPGTGRGDRAREWGSPLLLAVSAVLVFETVSGLAAWLLPFSALSQHVVLLHVLLGLVFLAPFAWYPSRHWAGYRRHATTHYKISGYVAFGLVAALIVTGLVLTAQAAFGRRISHGWDRAHLVATLAVLPFLLLHVVLLWLRDARGKAEALAPVVAAQRRFRWRVAALGLGAPALLVVASWRLAPGTRWTNELPADYAMPRHECGTRAGPAAHGAARRGRPRRGRGHSHRPGEAALPRDRSVPPQLHVRRGLRPHRLDHGHVGGRGSFVFWNAGAGKGYFDVAAASPALAEARVGRGAAFSDHDADGDVDAVVTTNGGPAVLLRNEGGNRRPWLEVRLKGTRSPGSGMGSRIEVEAGGVRQVRLAGGSSSYLSQSSTTTHFGLGAAERVDVVEVRWTSGHVDVVRDVPARGSCRWRRGGRLEVLARAGDVSLPTGGATRPSGPHSPIEEQREFSKRYARAQAARQAADLPSAIAAYGEALDLQSGHEDALYWLGNCLLEEDRAVEALAAWTRLARANPLSGRAHQQLGVVLSTPGPTLDLPEAEAHFRRAVEINREESGPFTRLGEVLLAQGEVAEAEEWLTAASRLNPKAAGALYQLAHLRWKQERGPVAVQVLQRAARALEADRPHRKGTTSEGDTQARLHALQAVALRRSLFGSLWSDLRERHDPEEIDASVAAAESARVDAFVADIARGARR
jgi:tetratricopeptide (TPR) repeat protein